MSDLALTYAIGLLVKQKAMEPERSNIEAPVQVVESVTSTYQSFGEQVTLNREIRPISNDDFRNFLRTER